MLRLARDACCWDTQHPSASPPRGLGAGGSAALTWVTAPQPGGGVGTAVIPSCRARGVFLDTGVRALPERGHPLPAAVVAVGCVQPRGGCGWVPSRTCPPWGAGVGGHHAVAAWGAHSSVPGPGPAGSLRPSPAASWAGTCPGPGGERPAGGVGVPCHPAPPGGCRCPPCPSPAPAGRSRTAPPAAAAPTAGGLPARGQGGEHQPGCASHRAGLGWPRRGYVTTPGGTLHCSTSPCNNPVTLQDAWCDNTPESPWWWWQKSREGRTGDELPLLVDDAGAEDPVPVEALHGGGPWVPEATLERGVGARLCRLQLRLVRIAQQGQRLPRLLRAAPTPRGLLQPPRVVLALPEAPRQLCLQARSRVRGCEDPCPPPGLLGGPCCWAETCQTQLPGDGVSAAGGGDGAPKPCAAGACPAPPPEPRCSHGQWPRRVALAHPAACPLCPSPSRCHRGRPAPPAPPCSTASPATSRCGEEEVASPPARLAGGPHPRGGVCTPVPGEGKEVLGVQLGALQPEEEVAQGRPLAAGTAQLLLHRARLRVGAVGTTQLNLGWRHGASALSPGGPRAGRGARPYPGYGGCSGARPAPAALARRPPGLRGAGSPCAGQPRRCHTVPRGTRR